MLFALVLSRLRYFYGVMLGTFVMSYMGNTVVEVSMRKGNKWLQRWVGVFVFFLSPERGSVGAVVEFVDRARSSVVPYVVGRETAKTQHSDGA